MSRSISAAIGEYEATQRRERGGWCVHRKLSDTESSYVSGPFTDEKAAQQEAEQLNNIHKEETA